MNWELQQAILIRSKLRNKFLESRSLRDKNLYNKQRNACATLLKNREVKNIVDNKKFWRTVKILFLANHNFKKINFIEKTQLLLMTAIL